MRALQLTDFGELTVVERDTPTPGVGEVLLAVHAVGICGSDLHGYTGENGRREVGQVMGHEAAGTVVEVGSTAAGIAVGTVATFNPVIGCGQCAFCACGETQQCRQRRVIGVDSSIVAAFAELVVVPADNIVPLPAGLPIELGALIEPLAVAAHAVARARLRGRERMLVVGGGPIGQSTVLAARRADVGQVIVVEPNRERRELCARLGADVLDPAEGKVPDLLADNLGGPADVAVDAVGTSASLDSAVRGTRPGSAIVLVGMGTPTLGLDAYQISTCERSVVGSFCYSHAEFAEVTAWSSTFVSELEAMVSRRVPLGDAPGTFARMAAGDVDAGKILIDLRETP